MSPAEEAIRDANVAGFDLMLQNGKPVVRHPEKGVVPNAALMAKLKEHKAEIIELLGGEAASMVTCRECKALIRGKLEARHLCDRRACPMRGK